MYIKISKGKKGGADYLRTGKKADSEYLRDEKDYVVPLYGDLNDFALAEDYTNKYKKDEWGNHHYTHISASFSLDDMKKLEAMPKEEQTEVLKSMTLEIIKHHTSGYDLENEVIAYAEAHFPKIKIENGIERKVHFHIYISHLNTLNETKLRLTFAKNSYIDNTLETFLNKKYGFEIPIPYSRIGKDKPFLSKEGFARMELSEALAHIKNRTELESFLNSNNIEFKKPTKSYPHYKVFNPKVKEYINLRGRNFKHLEGVYNYKYDKTFAVSNMEKSKEELGEVLSSYYKRRINDIHKRRSKESREALENIYAEESEKYKTEEQKQKDSYKAEYPNLTDKDKPKTYQEKIFYKHYKDLIRTDLKGYYIDTKDEKNVKFINKSKKIDVVDEGEKIISNNKVNNTKEEVALMLDIALAKKWDLATLKMEGNKEFQYEVIRQIAERLREKELKKETLPLTEAERPRPNSPLQYESQVIEDKQLLIQSEQQTDIKLIKTDLNAQTVLDYAIEKYKLNRADYELTNDNKINNINRTRQTPKNTIDFLQAECHLSTKESVAVNRDLFSKQTQSETIREEKE